MCTRSWADESCVQLCTHAVLRHEYRLRVRHQFQLKVMGSSPVKSMCVGKAGRKDRCTNQGLYYAQCLKRGLVASGANVLPHRDYLVSGEWVMNLLQQRKLAFGDSRGEFIKVGKNLPRLLQNLDTWGHEEEQILLQGHIGQVASKLSLLKKAVPESPRC